MSGDHPDVVEVAVERADDVLGELDRIAVGHFVADRLRRPGRILGDVHPVGVPFRPRLLDCERLEQETLVAAHDLSGRAAEEEVADLDVFDALLVVRVLVDLGIVALHELDEVRALDFGDALSGLRGEEVVEVVVAAVERGVAGRICHLPFPFTV